MFEYKRKVYYYETDKMGVVHHSNFVRWFEEARIDFLVHMGLPFENIEAAGVFSPVIGLNIRFKYFARFGDTFTVRLKMTMYTGMRFSVSYIVVNQDEKVLIEGDSDHVFVNLNYRPISLAKVMPEADENLKLFMDKQGAE